MAAVHIGDVGKQNKIDIDSNHVASTQGRKNTVTKLLKEAVEKEANGETAVYYWNKTEALSLAVESGLQLPGAHISDASYAVYSMLALLSIENIWNRRKPPVNSKTGSTRA